MQNHPKPCPLCCGITPPESVAIQCAACELPSPPAKFCPRCNRGLCAACGEFVEQDAQRRAATPIDEPRKNIAALMGAQLHGLAIDMDLDAIDAMIASREEGSGGDPFYLEALRTVLDSVAAFRRLTRRLGHQRIKLKLAVVALLATPTPQKPASPPPTHFN